MSVTALAISPTARPVSSDVEAICCDADDSVCALCATVPIMPLSATRVVVVGADGLDDVVTDAC